MARGWHGDRAGHAAAARKGKVSFSTNKYQGVHGRKPKGRGSWAIGVNRKVHFMRGTLTLSQAKAMFKIKMKRLGHRKDITAHILP
jgi:hypothetical protein